MLSNKYANVYVWRKQAVTRCITYLLFILQNSSCDLEGEYSDDSDDDNTFCVNHKPSLQQHFTSA